MQASSRHSNDALASKGLDLLGQVLVMRVPLGLQAIDPSTLQSPANLLKIEASDGLIAPLQATSYTPQPTTHKRQATRCR